MIVKICGITHPEDAAHAALAGADYIGILFSERSKRKVSVSLAKEIVHASKNAGAIPVGVFVEESATQILSFCERAGINDVQLHGEISRAAVPIIQSLYSIIYAIPVEAHGAVSDTIKLPPSIISLYDGRKGGMGIPFDWAQFSPPARKNWILAGGLTPDNIKDAITLLKPYGVDVSSGVEFNNSLRKDPALVAAFITAAKTTLGEKS